MKKEKSWHTKLLKISDKENLSIKRTFIHKIKMRKSMKHSADEKIIQQHL
jgi:hypothetical protein